MTQSTIHLLADGDEPVAVGFESEDEGDLSVRRAHGLLSYRARCGYLSR
ncbi:hypothetical protein AB0D13_13335 [Streptomyces sp. NPDC048430]